MSVSIASYTHSFPCCCSCRKPKAQGASQSFNLRIGNSPEAEDRRSILQSKEGITGECVHNSSKDFQVSVCLVSDALQAAGQILLDTIDGDHIGNQIRTNYHCAT